MPGQTKLRGQHRVGFSSSLRAVEGKNFFYLFLLQNFLSKKNCKVKYESRIVTKKENRLIE